MHGTNSSAQSSLSYNHCTHLLRQYLTNNVRFSRLHYLRSTDTFILTACNSQPSSKLPLSLPSLQVHTPPSSASALSSIVSPLMKPRSPAAMSEEIMCQLAATSVTAPRLSSLSNARPSQILPLIVIRLMRGLCLQCRTLDRRTKICS